MSIWIDPKITQPESNVTYLIWNEEESRQEIGWRNRHGVWFSHMSIDPVVTFYKEMDDDPQ